MTEWGVPCMCLDMIMLLLNDFDQWSSLYLKKIISGQIEFSEDFVARIWELQIL